MLGSVSSGQGLHCFVYEVGDLVRDLELGRREGFSPSFVDLCRVVDSS